MVLPVFGWPLQGFENCCNYRNDEPLHTHKAVKTAVTIETMRLCIRTKLDHRVLRMAKMWDIYIYQEFLGYVHITSAKYGFNSEIT